MIFSIMASISDMIKYCHWPYLIVIGQFWKNKSSSFWLNWVHVLFWVFWNSDDELRFMYENGQGHLTFFCIVNTVPSLTQIRRWMYQNPTRAIWRYLPSEFRALLCLSSAQWRRDKYLVKKQVYETVNLTKMLHNSKISSPHT